MEPIQESFCDEHLHIVVCRAYFMWGKYSCLLASFVCEVCAIMEQTVRKEALPCYLDSFCCCALEDKEY